MQRVCTVHNQTMYRTEHPIFAYMFRFFSFRSYFQNRKKAQIDTIPDSQPLLRLIIIIAIHFKIDERIRSHQRLDFDCYLMMLK